MSILVFMIGCALIGFVAESAGWEWWQALLLTVGVMLIAMGVR